MTKKTKSGITTSTTVETLLTDLTPEELIERGHRLASIEQDLADHTAHSEATKKALKSKESVLAAERSHIAGIVRSRQELRDVRVEVTIDYGAERVRRVRLDTGEQIEERELRPEERQRDMGFDPLPPPRADRDAVRRVQLEREADSMLEREGGWAP